MSVLMFRVRRYRVLLLFSAFAIALWYHFSPTDGSYSASDEWLQPTHDRGTTKEQIKSEWSAPEPDDAMPPAKGNPHGMKPEDTLEVTPTPLSLLRPGQFVQPSLASELAALETDTESEPGTETETETETEPFIPVRQPPSHDHVSRPPHFDDVLSGKFNTEDELKKDNAAHWTKLPEHFPIPPESIIPLPTGNPVNLPKIQFNFQHGSESNQQRNERLMRQGAVKDAFKHAWEGYRKFAWGHDEVTPVSGGSKDPFAGWAATLVDALDTMAIMGLHAEFEHALTGVAKIDFTTTSRNDIPMFETTIRYLGGLIGAYDVTGHKHKILLDKAIELAEILYNAFDTPNRMPVLYFEWHPESVKKKHRAGRTSCMAEIGSMSVEFTRLAQITGENKYYDAIQRITDEFEKFLPNTTLPGFWPTVLDASGCEWVEEVYTVTTTIYPSPTPKPNLNEDTPPALPTKKPFAVTKERLEKTEVKTVRKPTPPRVSEEDGELDEEKKPSLTQPREAAKRSPDSSDFRRRKRAIDDDDDETEGPNSGEEPSRTSKVSNKEKKMSELQNGLAEMEEKASESDKKQDVIAVSHKNPNAPTVDDEDEPTTPSKPSLKPKPTPTGPVVKKQVLTRERCVPSGFRMNEGENHYSYGGMADSTYEYLLKEHLLLGGLKEQYGNLYLSTYETGRDNLFFRPMTPKNSDILVSGQMKVSYDWDRHRTVSQLESSGSHLTCFVGGMVGMGSKIFNRPEDLQAAIKLTEGCVWNYFSTATGIMPEGFIMTMCPKGGDCKWDEDHWRASIIAPNGEVMDSAEQQHNITLVNPYAGKGRSPIYRRQVGYDGNKDLPPPALPNTHADIEKYMRTGEKPTATRETDGAEAPQREIPRKDPYERWVDSVNDHIKWTKLPEGYVQVNDPKYILRPEAIESVFYMYRITGDRSWQDKGWKMFQAIEKYTKTLIAHSAINNVLDTQAFQVDSMESFWLAETLKYFYLLFSEPDVISLDDYVLNTEAHPLKRPKHKAA
ncbi:hypothetical protein AOL_s00054g624 [Orbilia oligospora ATCC 24927]|uniref:alpha-1,2-Mannosidase n=2 Tax=Orbilia oligospora TaxID=2813651 RepID=G1X6Y0_ARTOA|nr:hypothetical protein AOL_s00054g624 [Orbilia oligospora ATCC 24927]EGX51085.1 hypothetical protein AOL_s00054g624 [Orbilia oligospora ATCC 24927]KAF3273390.1 hypothetical protein TWF970_009172 [Orbilia oligospora]